MTLPFNLRSNFDLPALSDILTEAAVVDRSRSHNLLCEKPVEIDPGLQYVLHKSYTLVTTRRTYSIGIKFCARA